MIMTPWLMAIFCLATAGCSNITDQQASESNQQVAILKQIRKVNEDGSYTFGYEAGDGSFKEHVTAVQSRHNRTTSSTRKPPTVVYATSSETSTKSSVVQSIPRTRKTTTTPISPTTITSSSIESTTKPGLSHFRTTTRSRPRFIINGQQRPPILEEESSTEDTQTKKPEEKVSAFRKIIFAKRPVDVTLRPITEEFEEKEEDDKITTGNSLRRQLHEETTKAVPIVKIENIEDDHGDHVYGGALSTTRPLFTTGNPPRIIQRVAPLRPERTKSVFINNNLGPARFDPEPKVQDDRANAAAMQQQILLGPQEQPRDLQTTAEQPVYVRQQDYRVLPPGGILVRGPPIENLLEEEPANYRTNNRVLYRPQQNVYPTTTTEPNVHYLTEQPVDDPRVNQEYVRRDRIYRPLPPYEPRSRPMLQPVRPIPRPIDDRDYQNLSPDGYQYSGPIALPPEPPNPIAPPLSRRDFQMLLRRLLVSQYGVQALTYPKTYLEDALYDQQPYPSYQSPYRTSAPRQDGSFEPRYGDRVPLVRSTSASSSSSSGYSRNVAPAYQMRYDDYMEAPYSKRVYRQKFYGPEDSEDGDEILPPPIREALLLRMLQLAINVERPPMSMAVPSTSRYRKMGPIRSVQIITDDSEEEKEARKKM
ncbi:uncharacterized protein LOC122498573 isoform X2 [Leptopilina heterotoma]|uniref:uncharacterized protein LOC122498573 isoform X2 n=1 Tax=Leptopilina heterotoma TaxID=63436 RepID=UPI001CA9975E|nr:uncharacterized protein LOC122498573 isoform X2 [Leptopilina heterotoma]